MHDVRSETIPNMFSLFLSQEVRMCHHGIDHTHIIARPKKQKQKTQALMSTFYWGFIIWLELIKLWVRGWTHLSFVQRLSWHCVTQSCNLLITWLVFLAQPAQMLGHLRLSLNYLGSSDPLPVEYIIYPFTLSALILITYFFIIYHILMICLPFL